MTRLVLDQALDPFSARVMVERDPDGAVLAARLDLDGLPRVDSILVGRAVADVPPLVERLCGVCPVAHHLAGVQALESLAGVATVPPAARWTRRLLHYGAVLSMHADRFRIAGYAGATALRQLAKLAQTAAGSPGHYPATAVVGGVAAAVQPKVLDQCRRIWPEALQAALDLAAEAKGLVNNPRAEALNLAGRRGGGDLIDADLAGPPETRRRMSTAGTDIFTGPDVALVDEVGHPDLLGPYLRAVGADGTVIIGRATVQDWPDLVTESDQGGTAPRPYLTELGPVAGCYRVGPLAQVRVGALGSPLAAELQQQWWSGHGGAYAARTVMAVHCVETIGQILDHPDWFDGPLAVPVAAAVGAGQAVGWVDGARGLLVHHYRSGADGSVLSAQVLTPTAQNEYWLSELLLQAVQGAPDGPVSVSADIEEAIREADPCLPCSLAPRMSLLIQTVAGSAVTDQPRIAVEPAIADEPQADSSGTADPSADTRKAVKPCA